MLHRKYGGSTAGRTRNCPAWHNIAKNMPGGVAGFAAISGTLMHLLFERGMTDPEFEPATLVGDKMTVEGTVITITAEMIEKVYTAFECQITMEENHQFETVLPEVVMNTDEETGGTADIIAYTLGAKKHVNIFGCGDLKTGDGHMVYAKDNDQLLFYTWQAIAKYRLEGFQFTDDTVFILYIIQPSERRDDPIDVWVTDLATIMSFVREYKQAKKMSAAGIMEPCPGSHCAYCPAMTICPAKTGDVGKALRIPAQSTEMKELVRGLALVDAAEEWCRAIRKTAHEQAEAGVKLEGYKLVNKRATRQWVDAPVTLSTFKKSRKLGAPDYYEQKLKSPAQMEKVCKQKGVDFKKYDSMIHLHSSGTTLAKDTDKRPEALPLARLAEMAAQIKK